MLQSKSKGVARAAIFIVGAAAFLFLYAGAAQASDYTPDVIFIKFNQDVTPEIVEGIVQTGIAAVDTLNENYGVYDFEQMLPLPGNPLEHPDGLWDWDDYTAAYDEFKLGRIYLFKFPADYKNVAGAVNAYNEVPEVEYADLDWYLELAATPNDPFYLNPTQQWYLYKIKAGPAWDYSKGAGVKIAVIDSGVWAGHPDLDAKITAGWDFVDDDAEPEDETTHSHGTHVTGIAAAETNNAFGMAGLGWNSTVMPLKIFKPDRGYTPAAEVTPHANICRATKAVKWAVDNYAHVINMSFGTAYIAKFGPLPVVLKVFAETCGFAYKLNLILAAAAGNYEDRGILYPAKFPTVIAVGATNRDDEAPDGYAKGPEMELCAPGVDIISTAKSKVAWDGNQYSWAYLTGTSMSAPLVTATAALCRAKWPTATAAEIRKIMQGFSDDLGPPGKDDTYGFGRVNPYKIFSRAEGKTLEEVVAAAEDEIAELLELGANYGQFIDEDTAAAVYGP